MENDKPGFFAEVKEMAENILHDRMLLIKLEATERLAQVVSKTYILLPIIFLLLLIMMLITFLVGYYLSVWLGAYWLGFGIVLLLYVALIFLLLYWHRSKLQQSVADKVVKTILE